MTEDSTLAAVTKKAIDVLGSRETAEHWLATPTRALDSRRPLDLLHDAKGAEVVITLLIRMDYCVYT
ncbi:antitoxin Xre/MbcA/ParS toxin-binding domain-containing protein [Paraburkholderia youngii]|uniref:antitoxin Xre/MbcA/ParS toxin-binding domain-containing protein n=1 Tax=Paraburkholderia youngii TaxID=2782701 RepID=UPI003D233981